MEQTGPDLRIPVNKWSWAFIANDHVTGATENWSGAAGGAGGSVEPGKTVECTQVGLFMACWWTDNFPYERNGQARAGRGPEKERETKEVMNKSDS